MKLLCIGGILLGCVIAFILLLFFKGAKLCNDAYDDELW